MSFLLLVTVACSGKGSDDSATKTEDGTRGLKGIKTETIAGSLNAQGLLTCSKKAKAAAWGATAEQLAECGPVPADLQYVLCYDNKQVDLECLAFQDGLNVTNLEAYDAKKAAFDTIQATISANLNKADHAGCQTLAANASKTAPGFVCVRLSK